MRQSRYLTLFEFNWLPALYAHPSRTGAWERLLAEMPMRTSGCRLVHRASRDLLEQWGDTVVPLTRVPVVSWPLAPQQWLNSLAMEVGLACISGTVRSTLARDAVVRLVGIAGTAARRRCFSYAERFRYLSGSAPKDLQVESARQLVGVGGQVLTAAIDASVILGSDPGDSIESTAVTQGVRQRVGLRFPMVTSQVTLVPEAIDEVQGLIDEILQGASGSAGEQSGGVSPGDVQ